MIIILFASRALSHFLWWFKFKYLRQFQHSFLWYKWIRLVRTAAERRPTTTTTRSETHHTQFMCVKWHVNTFDMRHLDKSICECRLIMCVTMLYAVAHWSQRFSIEQQHQHEHKHKHKHQLTVWYECNMEKNVSSFRYQNWMLQNSLYVHRARMKESERERIWVA